jgi:hypothetical protein
MRARVYLFVRKGERRPVYEVEDSQGRPLPITWRALPQALNHDVYRLEFRPLLPGSATLFWRDGRGERIPMMSVMVSERWKAPDEPMRILEQEFSFFDGCPRTHTRNLVVSIIASAYRVTFASSREDYLAGRTRSLIIPGEAHADGRGIASTTSPPGRVSGTSSSPRFLDCAGSRTANGLNHPIHRIKKRC